MKGKAKTYFICGILFVVAGILAFFSKSVHYAGYASIAMGCCMFALSYRENKKTGSSEEKQEK